jgi:ribonuclease HI
LIHIDGACPGNGTQTAFGGVGVYFGSSSSYNLNAPLIDSKTVKPLTSQKDELQAAASALKIIRNDCMPARHQLLKQFLRQCACHTECWAAGSPFQVVLVTDSAYLFDCITSHLLIWRWDSETRHYSNKKSGNIIKNSEYIRNIVEEVEMLAERGVQVLWKKVPRASNHEADRLAKAGAEMSRTSSVTTRRSSVVWGSL